MRIAHEVPNSVHPVFDEVSIVKPVAAALFASVTVYSVPSVSWPVVRVPGDATSVVTIDVLNVIVTPVSDASVAFVNVVLSAVNVAVTVGCVFHVTVRGMAFVYSTPQKSSTVAPALSVNEYSVLIW